MDTFRIAGISVRSVPGSPEKNVDHLAAWATKAKKDGADVVCFPELSATGYFKTSDIWEAAEPVPGPTTEALIDLAKELDLIVAAGVAEKDRGLVYNAYVCVGSEGYLGKSRKIHIPPSEVKYWRGGGIPPVIDIGLAKVGINICFDNWLPESGRLVALQGAEIIIAPYVWSVGPQDDAGSRNRAWKDYAGRTFPARAIDNGVFLVAVNACGPTSYGDYAYDGNPMVLIYSPLGQLVAESPDEADDEVMVVADLDGKLLRERRSQGVFHPRFRRPELYGLLSDVD